MLRPVASVIQHTNKDCRSGMPDGRACWSLHLHGEWSLLRMAGGQCPPKGGQLTTTTLLGQLVNPLTTS